jgi:hypothetical protein
VLASNVLYTAHLNKKEHVFAKTVSFGKKVTADSREAFYR